MYTVVEVSERLNVSKVTIYSKLRKFKDKVVMKHGQRWINDELFKIIKEDLKLKDIDIDTLNDDIAMDIDNIDNIEFTNNKEDLVNFNKDLINTLIEQLNIKDKQMEAKDIQISELHHLIENSQVLLKQEKEVNQLQLEEHLQELDLKLNDVKEKMEQRKTEKKKGLFEKIFK
jgi:hypothetical protein